MKELNEMTKKEFEAVPYLDEGNYTFNSFILLPTRKVHESGYSMFNAILLMGNTILGKIADYDVVNLEINDKEYLGIDCLKKSKLIRIWSRYENSYIYNMNYGPFRQLIKKY